MYKQVIDSVTAADIVAVIVAVLSLVATIVTSVEGVKNQKKINDDNVRVEVLKKANKLLNMLFNSPRIVYEYTFYSQLFDLKAEMDTVGSDKQIKEYNKLYAEINSIYNEYKKFCEQYDYTDEDNSKYWDIDEDGHSSPKFTQDDMQESSWKIKEFEDKNIKDADYYTKKYKNLKESLNIK